MPTARVSVRFMDVAWTARAFVCTAVDCVRSNGLTICSQWLLPRVLVRNARPSSAGAGFARARWLFGACARGRASPARVIVFPASALICVPSVLLALAVGQVLTLGSFAFARYSL
jgi:hypothetical protein